MTVGSYLAVTSYIPCEWLFSWYTTAGHVNKDKLSRLLARYEHKVNAKYYTVELHFDRLQPM